MKITLHFLFRCIAHQSALLLILSVYSAALAGSEYEDRPASFVPRQAATPEELDRREALALFADARSLELQEQYAEALRKYQRAVRLDPRAAEPFEGIVLLALRLNRPGVANRYAVSATDRDEATDPIFLFLSADRFEKEGDWKSALKYYNKILERKTYPKPLKRADLFLRVGRIAYLAEDYRRATELFSQVMRDLDQPPNAEITAESVLDDPPAAYQIFGECFLRTEQFDAAESAFRKAEQARSQPAHWKFNQARLAARRGQPAVALGLLDEAFAAGLSGFGMTPYEELEKVLGALSKGGELIDRLEKLRKNDPENAPLGYYLAAQYRRAGRLDQADALYAALLEKSPTLTGYQDLAAIRRETKNFPGLLRLLGMVIEQAGFLDPLGEEERKLVEDDGLLTGLIETARKKLPAPPDKNAFAPRLALGLLALEAERWDAAEEFFEAAARSDPQRAGQAYLDWGVGLLVAEQSARAEKVFRAAIERKYLPDDMGMLYFYLAGALSMEDRIDEALDAARKALQLKTRLSLKDVTDSADQPTGPSSAPERWWQQGMEWLQDKFSGAPVDSVRFVSRVGWVLSRGKRYDEALRIYRGLIEKFDSDYSSDRLRDELKAVRLEASGVAALAGRNAEAEEWLEQVLDEYPDDPGASNDLSYLWADENRHLHRALRLARRAVSAEPDNAAYRDSLGWTLYRLGNTTEAIAELEKASAAQPDGEILDHLGDAYRAAHRPDDARRAWQKAAKAYRKAKQPEKADAVQKKT